MMHCFRLLNWLMVLFDHQGTRFPALSYWRPSLSNPCVISCPMTIPIPKETHGLLFEELEQSTAIVQISRTDKCRSSKIFYRMIYFVPSLLKNRICRIPTGNAERKKSVGKCIVSLANYKWHWLRVHRMHWQWLGADHPKHDDQQLHAKFEMIHELWLVALESHSEYKRCQKRTRRERSDQESTSDEREIRLPHLSIHFLQLCRIIADHIVRITDIFIDRLSLVITHDEKCSLPPRPYTLSMAFVFESSSIQSAAWSIDMNDVRTFLIKSYDWK